jgi:hypothetical protein
VGAVTGEQEMVRVLWEGIFAAAERRRFLGGGDYKECLALVKEAPLTMYFSAKNCCPELRLVKWSGVVAQGKEWHPIEGYEWGDVVVAATREGLITSSEAHLRAAEDVRPYLWPWAVFKGLP